MTFALGTFSRNNSAPYAGLVINDHIVDLRELAGLRPQLELRPDQAGSVLALLTQWDDSLPVLEELAASLPEIAESELPRHVLSDLKVHAPVQLPRQIFCTGANYRKHVAQICVDMGVGPEGLSGEELRRWAEKMMDERAAKGDPYVFTKVPSAITGAYDPILLPAHVNKPDWEIELGVIIGRGGRYIERRDALSHVAGYAILNDVSARDLIARTDWKALGTDWLRSKCLPTFLPFGPYLVPAKFVADPQDLHLCLKLNGAIMQDENTADMLFDVARQIEYISRYAELWPGDLIATGSPAGNGTHHKRFLRAGDVVEAEITGLGRQRNVCSAE